MKFVVERVPFTARKTFLRASSIELEIPLGQNCASPVRSEGLIKREELCLTLISYKVGAVFPPSD